MKHTHDEPNSNLSKQWAEYLKSWQMNKKQKSTKKRSLKHKALAKPVNRAPSQPVFFSAQEIRQATLKNTVLVGCCFKQELIKVNEK